MTEPASIKPSWMPQHLAGKVGDFRREPDGSVSFLHNEAALGGFGPEENRQVLSPEQYNQTFDRSYRLANPEESLRKQYGLPSVPTSKSEDLKQWLADKVKAGLRWGTTSQAKSVGTGALLSALAGGAAGAYLNRDEESPVASGLLYALLAGGAGAGAVALAQRQHNARQAYMGKQASHADDIIIEALMSDNHLSDSQKRNCLMALSSASSSDRAQLSSLLRGAIGSAAGVVIMKFLGAKGLLPLAVGGIIGAAIGSGMSSGARYNPMGQLST